MLMAAGIPFFVLNFLCGVFSSYHDKGMIANSSRETEAHSPPYLKVCTWMGSLWFCPRSWQTPLEAFFSIFSAAWS